MSVSVTECRGMAERWAHTHTLRSRVCRYLWLLLLCLQDEEPAEEAEMDDETWAKNVTAGGAAACLPQIPPCPAMPNAPALLFWIRVVSPCQLSHEAGSGWRTPATQAHSQQYAKPLCVCHPLSDKRTSQPLVRPNTASLCVTASLCDTGKLSKGEKLAAVDHNTVDYPPFRRRFYIEVPEIQRMTEEDVAVARKTEGIKVGRQS